MQLTARLKSRAHAWARARQGEDRIPLVLRARRIYILPTRAGYGLGVVLFIMVAAGLNYGNSLALLFTFLIAGYAVVGMHECHRTLKNLELVHVEAHDSFAGERGRLELRFANPTAETRCALSLDGGAAQPTGFELPGKAVSTVATEFQAVRRGRQALPRLRLETTAPLGLFRAWAWLHLGETAIVYPRPAGTLPLPSAGARTQQHRAAAARTGDDEWASLRPYQSGDSPRSVAWKLYARGAALLVAQYESQGGARRVLDYDALATLDTEPRLAQLAQWVGQCERDAEAYRLVLPRRRTLEFGVGPRQRRRALRMLALHGLDADPAEFSS